MPVTVALASGALNQTSSEHGCGAGVAPGVGVGVGEGVGLGVGDGVGLGVGAAFCTFSVMTSFFVLPAASNPVAVSVCVPFAKLVVSMTHSVQSACVG